VSSGFYYPMPPPADDVAERGTKAWRQAVNARRAWTGNELWTAQARQNLNLSNMNDVTQFLASRGITNEIGGGRHALRLFTGDLPGSEGGGMGFRGIPHAMEQYMPDWKFNLDRAIQGGQSRTDANQRFQPWQQQGQAPDLSGGGTFNFASMNGGQNPTTPPGVVGQPTQTLGTLGADDDWRKRLGL
jgi:hypothetical protein